MTSRKAIYAALFARFAGIAALTTKSRTLASWGDVSPQSQPALYQTQGNQTGVTTPRTPTKWTLAAELHLYAHASNVAGGGDAVELLDDLVDAVLAAIAPDPGPDGRQTLGGLVHDVRVDGTIETDEGRLGKQAVAIIPVIIIANV